MKKQKGITLVALIITIIIMLILVAVSVNVIIKSNLIGTAEKTANGYKTAQDRENNGTITINGKTYASIEEYMLKTNIAGGTRVTTNTEYTIEGETRTAEIPAGFTVSGIYSERTIEKGLVIYDIPEGTTVDWTKPDTVKTAYNQFVWIPVEVTASDTETSVAAFARSKWTSSADGGQRTNTISSNYTEPYSGTDDYDGTGEGKTGIAAQITELTKSIYNYGGFWIGRYEAGVKPAANGTATPRTKSSSQTAEFVVQQDKYPYNYIKWGTSMGDVSTEGAVYLCNNLYTDYETYGVKSMLCTGAAWDSMLNFIKDSTHSVTDDKTWGDYYNFETYQITRGKLSIDQGSTWTAASSLGTDVTLNYRCVLTTGATEKNGNKNLYDLAKCGFEWTTEVFNSRERVVRGGTSNYYQILLTPSFRSGHSTTDVSNHYGGHMLFRPLLYIKEL